MTRLDRQPVPADIQPAVGQTIADLGAAFSGVLVNIGRRPVAARSPLAPVNYAERSAS